VQQTIVGDAVSVGRKASLDVSVVCPFFNEAEILETAIRALTDRLAQRDWSWELIVVNDGSSDESGEIAARLSAEIPNLRCVGYRYNRGRGHALRTGIAQARGEIIVTTEIDLSWGEDIVEQLFDEFQANPDADMVVASPHLEGGGYKNVPAKRVFFSSFGNWVIRALMSDAVSMNTGMTRGYRRDSIRSLPLADDRKEFHLEVILKAQALGYRIREIPATLEWKQYKHEGQRVERKSSSKVNRLILTHSLFSLFGNPVRYVWKIAGVALLLSIAFLIAALVLYFNGQVSVYGAILSVSLAIMATLLFGIGVLAQQSNIIQRELWTLKQELWFARQSEDDEVRESDSVAREP
jgi:glycosyltransferase involved in cell wall biosynthesis